jgi:hypothetical protein
LFFNGDMIFGYGRPILPAGWTNGMPNSWTTTATSVSPDVVFEYIQYAYWRGMIANLFLAGTYVLPVPGNHETQCSYSAEPYTSSPNPNCNNASGTVTNTSWPNNLTGKTAYPDNENMFRFNMGDLVNDLQANIRFSNVTGFFATSPNGLTQASAPGATDTVSGNSQQYLTYSFDIAPATGVLLHFVVINTDPSGNDGTAPVNWLTADFAAAKSRGVTNIFVFGHKPAFTYNYLSWKSGTSVLPPSTNPGPGGLDATYTATTTNGVTTYSTPNRDAFWSLIAEYGATYFSGHEHTVNVSQQPDPTGTNTIVTPYQVIVGSGGSPFDDKLIGTCTNTVPQTGCSEPNSSGTHEYDRFYAWATVQVHQSGKISLQINGFNDQFGLVQDLTIPNDSGLYDVATLQTVGQAQTSAGTSSAAKRKKTTAIVHARSALVAARADAKSH